MVKGGLTEKRKKEDSLWEKLGRKEIKGGEGEFLETNRRREEKGSWWRATEADKGNEERNVRGGQRCIDR
jgi:hypothetical protein